MPQAQLSPGETKLFESGGTDDSVLREENPTIAPPAETAGDPPPGETGSDGGETPEAKIARERAETDKTTKADRDARRKAAIEEFNLVDLAAVHEARTESRATKAELAALKARLEKVEPLLSELKPKQGVMQNPYQIGTEQHTLWEQASPEQKHQAWEWETQKRELAELKAGRVKDQETVEARQRSENLINWGVNQEREFIKVTPDYAEATAFARAARDRQLAVFYPDPNQRAQIINTEIAQIIAQAAQATAQGNPTNPAQKAYEFAQANGYVPKAAGDNAAVKKIQAGQKAAGGLNGGGSTPKTELTIEDINRMPTRTPAQRKAYNDAWEKWSKQA